MQLYSKFLFIYGKIQFLVLDESSPWSRSWPNDCWSSPAVSVSFTYSVHTVLIRPSLRVTRHRHPRREEIKEDVTPARTFRRVWHMFFVCFFLNFFLGPLRILQNIKNSLVLLEIYYNIITVRLYPPRIGAEEKRFEKSHLSHPISKSCLTLREVTRHIVRRVGRISTVSSHRRPWFRCVTGELGSELKLWGGTNKQDHDRSLRSALFGNFPDYSIG